MKHACLLLPLISLAGCSTRDLSNTSKTSVHVAGFIAEESAYSSSLAMGIVPTVFAKEVTWDELLQRVQLRYDPKFGLNCYYIGQKNGFNYFIISPILDSREFLKVKVGSHTIEDSFELTTDSDQWIKFELHRSASLENGFLIPIEGDAFDFKFEPIETGQDQLGDYMPIEEIWGKPAESLNQEVTIDR